jgi:hypothetical protein
VNGATGLTPFGVIAEGGRAIHDAGPPTTGPFSMSDLTLYHAAPSRSSIVLWMLEEVAEPYDIKLIKLSAGENLTPAYLAINPMGKVPALDHKGTIITEVAAICTYLADAFPDKKLNVPIGTPRAAFISHGCSSGRAAWSRR